MESIVVITGMTMLGIALVSVMNAICFLIGARIAQKASNNDEIKLPNINPLEIAKEHRERKEAEREQTKFDIMLENINNDKGDSTGQKDIPR